MKTYSLSGHISEERSNSLIELSKMSLFLDKVFEQKFCKFDGMNLNLGKKNSLIIPFDPLKCRNSVLKEKKAFWGILSQNESNDIFPVKGDAFRQTWMVSREKDLTQLNFNIYNHPDLYEQNIHLELIDYLKGFIPLLENFDTIMLNSLQITSYADFYSAIGIERRIALPCFSNGGFMEWVHIISPLAYEKYFTKEVLLGAPAYKTQELENGIVMLMNYANPFECETAETIERIIALNKYFWEHNLLVPTKME